MLHIRLLGNLAIRKDDTPLAGAYPPRLQALLAFLLLHRQSPQSRHHLAFQFWPDSSEKQAHTNLRKLIFQLQHVLPEAERFLLATTQTLGWNPQAPFTLDVAELERLLAHLQNDPLDLEALRQVVELYHGELVPGCYDDWITPLRQRLHQSVIDALERLVTLLENQRSYAAGIEYARRLLAFDPLEEKSYQRLMRLHALDGDYAGALRVYQDCVTVLQRELEVDPAEETQTLYQRLRLRDGSLLGKAGSQRAAAQALPLIGRQAEWQQLQTAWRQAVRGQSHFVSIWGEAGIGKTRLAEELLDWANRQGILAARTRSYQAQGALAYAPLTTLLRSPLLTARLSKLGYNWLSEVARLLPELLEQHPQLPPPQPMSESWQRQRFFEAVARALLVDHQPLLLLFDDLHWCDPETVTWFDYLLHFAPQARLLVVGTSRIEEVDDRHPLTALCLNLRREALITEINLAPLTAAEATTLASTVIDQALTDEQAQRLYADTEGNPLFVVETVRAGLPDKETRREGDLASSLLPVSSTHLPVKVHAVIRSRLLQLSPQAQQVASLAAVIGRSFPFALLLAAAQGAEDALINSLDELSGRRILREQGADGYDFSHDRIRDVAYAELSQARRRQLHRHVAEALEAVYAHHLDERSGVLADHWEQAGNRPKAVIYLQRASTHAATHYLHSEALHYISRALDLVPPEKQSELAQLLLARQRIHGLQGNRSAQQKDFALLQEILAAWHGDRQQALTIGAEVAVRLSRYERYLANLQESIAYAQQAVALAEEGNAAQQKADGLLEWGFSLWTKADFAAARQQWTQALQTAEAANLPSRLAESLERLAQIDIFTGGSATGVRQYLERALENYEKDGNLIGKCNILNKLGYLPMAQGVGEHSKSRGHYEQALALSRKIGARANEATILRNLGILSVCEGDYAQAERVLETAHQIYLEMGAKNNMAVVLYCFGFTYLNKGQLAQAKSVQENALQQLRQHQFAQWEVKAITSVGWIHLLLGDLTAAHEYASEAKGASLALKEQRQAAYASACLGHILIQLQRYPEAATEFQQAVTWHTQMQQENPRLEPLAGLAQVALLQGEMAQAQEMVEEIILHLQSHTLDLTQEAFRVYLTCYDVLRARGDQRAPAMLRTAYDQLQRRAATIDDPQAERRFWEDMPGHQAVRLAIDSATPLKVS